MRTTKFFAAASALLTITVLAPQPGWAQYAGYPPQRGGWKFMLLQTLGPPLINRGFDYLMRKSKETQYRPSYSAAPKATASHTVPPPPSTPRRTPYKAPKQSSSRSTKLAVPPPPQTLVPPPPPGVPTGAILGQYPPELNVPSIKKAQQ